MKRGRHLVSKVTCNPDITEQLGDLHHAHLSFTAPEGSTLKATRCHVARPAVAASGFDATV